MAVKTMLENWKAKKEAERTELYAQIDAGIDRATQTADGLREFLQAQGRLSARYDARNVLLILHQCPDAQAVMSMEDWNRRGRSVNKGATALHVLAKKDRYTQVANVFDVSQTNGKKPFVKKDFAGDDHALSAVLHTLKKLAPAEIADNNTVSGAVFDSGWNNIFVPPGLTDKQLFQQLPTAVVQAHLYAAAPEKYDPAFAKMYGECVAAELCSRFGMEPPALDYKAMVQGFTPWEHGQRGKMLEEVHEFAKTMGDQMVREGERNLPEHSAPKSVGTER